MRVHISDFWRTGFLLPTRAPAGSMQAIPRTYKAACCGSGLWGTSGCCRAKNFSEYVMRIKTRPFFFNQPYQFSNSFANLMHLCDLKKFGKKFVIQKIGHTKNKHKKYHDFNLLAMKLQPFSLKSGRGVLTRFLSLYEKVRPDNMEQKMLIIFTEMLFIPQEQKSNHLFLDCAH